MRKKADLWMPWYLGDYLRDTTHLSRSEHGSYLLMLAHAWMHNGALPTDDERLARIAHCTQDEWLKCKNVILEFWSIEGDVYTQKRLSAELKKAQGMVQQRIAAGIASANKRWGNERYNENVTSVKSSFERNGQRNDTPSQPQNYKTNQSQKHAHSRLSEFDTLFWPTYPKKVSKGQAEKAWAKNANGNIDAIMTGLSTAITRWKSIDPKFIPHPATWLNAKGWLDEQPIPQPEEKKFVI